MGSPTEIAQWKQRIESLKSRERQVRIESNEDFKSSNLMAPQLYMATRSGSMPDFLAVLERLCESRHVSDIVEQVTRGGNTILHLAAKNLKADILGQMANQFPQLIMRKNITGDTTLHFAARTKDLRLIRVILNCNEVHFGNRRNKLLRMENEVGNTALHEAVKAFHLEGVELLFKEDKDVANYLNKEGKSPLYLAVETGHDGIVDLLLRAPLQNRERHHGTSPLHAAIMAMSSGRDIIYKYESLLEGWGIDYPAASDSRDESSTHELSADNMLKGFFEIIYLKDQNGCTALHLAASMGNLEGVRTILEACPQSALEWDLKGYLPIHIACEKGRVNVVKEFLLKQEPWFDPTELLNQKGQNLLHIAAKSGKEKVVEYVLNEQKLEELLNRSDKNGNTPLHLASKYLHPNVLRSLTKDKRLNVNLVNNEGLTARDIVVLNASTPKTFREHLSFAVLEFAGTPLSGKGRKIGHLYAEPQIEWIKDRVSLMVLVATLIATVTFAAGFTVPGGINSSEYKDTKKIGMATSINIKMFQLFTISDAIAMYSSTMGFSILLLAHLGNFHLALNAFVFALYLVGFAVITMSVAFMAALHLAVRNVPWLAGTVIAIGVIFILMILSVFIILGYPLRKRALFLRHISDFIIKILIRFSGSHGKLRKVKVKGKKGLEETNKEEEKDEPQQTRMERPVRRYSF